MYFNLNGKPLRGATKFSGYSFRNLKDLTQEINFKWDKVWTEVDRKIFLEDC